MVFLKRPGFLSSARASLRAFLVLGLFGLVHFPVDTSANRLPNPEPNLPEHLPLQPAVITPEGERVLLEAAPGVEVRFVADRNEVEVTPAGHWLINFPLDEIQDLPAGGAEAFAQAVFGRSAADLRNWYFKTPGEPEWIVPAQTGPAPIRNTPGPDLVVDREAPNASDGNPGTMDQPLATIGEAVGRAGPGTVIHVYPGIYRERVTVNASGTEAAPIRIEGVRGADGSMPVVTGNDPFPANAWTPEPEWPGVYRANLFTNVLGTVSNGGEWLIERDLPHELGENEVALSRSSRGFLDVSRQSELVPEEGTSQFGATWQRVATDGDGFIRFGQVYGTEPAGEAIIWMSTWIWVEPGDRDSLDPDAPVPVAGEAYVAAGFRAGRMTGGPMHWQRNQYRIWVDGERVPVMRYFDDLNQQLHREPVSARNYGFGDVWNSFPLSEGWNHVVFQMDTSYRPDLLDFRIRAGRGMPNWIASADAPANLSEPPVSGVSNQYIDEYMVLGPFPTSGTERAVYVRLSGDADPNQAEMDLSARRDHMVHLVGDFVQFRGFEVRHGAHYQQTAMVQVEGMGSLLEGCLVRDGEVRGLGVYLRDMDQHDPPIIIRNNWVINMGNLGLGATGGSAFLTEENLNDPIPGRGRTILEHNHIENANWAGYVSMDESGGMKVFRLSGSHIRYNTFKGGHGPAIWLDWEHYNNRIEGNRVIDGYALAVGVEASPGPHLVANNVSVNLRPGPAWFRSGVLTWSSDRTLIMHNTIDGRNNPLPAWQGRSGTQAIATVEGGDDRGTRFVPLQNRSQTIANNLMMGVNQGIQSRSTDLVDRNARDVANADWLPDEWPVFPEGDRGNYRLPLDNSLTISGTLDHGTTQVRHDFFGLLRFDGDGRSVGAFRGEWGPRDPSSAMIEAEFNNGETVRLYEVEEVLVDLAAIQWPFEYRFGEAEGRDDGGDFTRNNQGSWTLESESVRLGAGPQAGEISLSTVRVGNPGFPPTDFVIRAEASLSALAAGDLGARAGLVLFGEGDFESFDPRDPDSYLTFQWRPNASGGAYIAVVRGMDGVELARTDFADLPNPPASPSASDPEAGLGVPMTFEFRGSIVDGGNTLEFVASLVDPHGRRAEVVGTVAGPFAGMNRFGFGGKSDVSEGTVWDFRSVSWSREVTPLLHYPFDEAVGSTTPNVGTRGNSDLTMRNFSNNTVNLLGPDGSGVSGRAGTRALDFSGAVAMGGNGPIAIGAQAFSSNTTFESFSLTGWFRTAGTTPYGGVARLWDLGGGNLQVLGDNQLPGSINVQMNDSRNHVSDHAFQATQEWVFYAIVYNGPAGQLDFYRGGKEESVTRVGSIGNLNFGDVSLSRLVIGNRSLDRGRAFHGYLDDMRFYAETTGSAAALIPSDLDAIRREALFEPEPVSFEGWRKENFAGGDLNDPAISGARAAPAGDGVENLLRYAFGFSAWERVVLDDLFGYGNGGDGFSMVYLERTTVPDLIYSPEVSTDLVEWKAGPPYLIETGRTGEDEEFDRVTVEAALPEDSSKGFLRLRVRQR